MPKDVWRCSKCSKLNKKIDERCLHCFDNPMTRAQSIAEHQEYRRRYGKAYTADKLRKFESKDLDRAVLPPTRFEGYICGVSSCLQRTNLNRTRCNDCGAVMPGMQDQAAKEEAEFLASEEAENISYGLVEVDAQE